MNISGFINIDKPCNMTSYDVIRILKRYTGKQKIGHGGILDRPAVGVLPVGLGNATKLFEYFHLFSKTYAGIIALGISTTTDDSTGDLLKIGDNGNVSLAGLQTEAASWVGSKMQYPPMYSSIKKEGKELYKYARAAETVEIQPRNVVFYQINLDNLREFGEVEQNWVNTLDNVPESVKSQLHSCLFVNFLATCSSGTYMRSLARDLGSALGSQGTLLYLNRTRVGSFNLSTAIKIHELDCRLKNEADLGEFVTPCSDVFDMHESVVLGGTELSNIFNGRLIDVDSARIRYNSTELEPFGDSYYIKSSVLFGVNVQEQLVCTLNVVKIDSNTGTVRLKLAKRIQ